MMAAYPLKNWKLSMVKKTCQQVDATGLATECKAGSGRTTLAVSFPVLSMTALDCYPVDISSSKMACQHTQLVPRRTGSKPTAQISLPKTCGLQIHPSWTLWITMSGGNVGGLSQAPSETKNDRRSLSCQRVLKATEGLCCSWGWTLRTFTVTAMSWLCYFWTMLFYFVIAWTFLSVRKSLGANTVMPITLEHYKLITCW